MSYKINELEAYYKLANGYAKHLIEDGRARGVAWLARELAASEHQSYQEFNMRAYALVEAYDARIASELKMKEEEVQRYADRVLDGFYEVDWDKVCPHQVVDQKLDYHNQDRIFLSCALCRKNGEA